MSTTIHRRRALGAVAGLGAVALLGSSSRTLAAPNVEANKATVRRYFEDVLTGRDLDAIDELVASDYRTSDPSDTPGRDALRARLTDQMDQRDVVLTEHQFVVDRVIGEGDLVAAQVRLVGSSTGGRDIDVLFLAVYELSNGQIAAAWSLADGDAFAQQMAG